MADNIYIPNIQPALKPIQHISPSLFSALKQCRLRAVLYSNRLPNLLPASPSSRLGSIVHKIIEQTGGHFINEESFQHLWNSCVRLEEEQMTRMWHERHLIPLSVTAHDFHVKRNQCFLLLQGSTIRARTIETRSQKTLNEVWMKSEDGIVVGRSDKITVDTDGVTIIDFKTGNIFDQRSGTEIYPEYKEQLKLYAALYHEENKKWPDRLLVVGLNGKNHAVDFEENECQKLLDEAKEILSKTNAILETENLDPSKLACPSIENCQYCLYRPICTHYFRARERLSIEGWPNDIWGTVSEKRKLGNGLGKIILTLSNKTHSVSVRGLRFERHPALDNPKKVAMFSLVADNTTDSYREGHFTTIYVLE